jgi:hypothetical protein
VLQSLIGSIPTSEYLHIAGGGLHQEFAVVRNELSGSLLVGTEGSGHLVDLLLPLLRQSLESYGRMERIIFVGRGPAWHEQT